jgi:ABC-type uncharacterized transport system substrate-binding protein
MRRREFITLLGGGAASAWPLTAHAQRPAVPVIGFLSAGFGEAYSPYLAALHRGLREAGYIEGQTLNVEYRWAEGQFDRLPTLASDLARLPLAALVTSGISSGLAAKAAISTIPHVFLCQDDPVKLGFVESFNRPGGNATGIALLTSVLVKKRLEFVRELVPNAATIAVLANPTSPESGAQLSDVQIAAQSLGQKIQIVNAASDGDFDTVFATRRQQQFGALLVTTDPLFYSRRYRITALATRHAIPAIYDRREFATAGGLMTYGANLRDEYRQLGIYTAKILNGTKPADMAVMQPIKFELVINVNTAKAIGLDVPPLLLARAHEVIE